MNNILEIINDSDLDNTLDDLWNSNIDKEWTEFIKSLDDNIVDVCDNFDTTTHITFKDEQTKMFFILKYS